MRLSSGTVAMPSPASNTPSTTATAGVARRDHRDRRLDVGGFRGGARFSLHWVMTHMIEEYARYLGHADLLRERLDGSTGG